MAEKEMKHQRYKRVAKAYSIGIDGIFSKNLVLAGPAALLPRMYAAVG